MRIKSKYNVKYYYIDGMEENFLYPDDNRILHREGLPAVVSDFYPTEYYIDGKLHNMNGPAIIFKNNKRLRNKWFYRGIEIFVDNQEDYNKEVKRLIFS